jgi:hypothetical protein
MYDIKVYPNRDFVMICLNFCKIKAICSVCASG